MEFETISAKDVEKYIGITNVMIIDIRSPNEYWNGHIPSAVNIPYRDFDNYKSYLSKNDTIILYCERGGTSLVLSRNLSKEGYHVKNIYGGILAYRGQLE